MKAILTLSALFLMAMSSAFSEVPAVVLEQMRTDLAEGLRTFNPNLPDEGVAREWARFQRQVSDISTDLGKNFVFSETEAKDFTEGKSAPSDEDLSKQVGELEKLMPLKKSPKMLGYYEKLRSEMKLTPQQRIIHSRTVKAVIARLKKKAQPDGTKQ